jgi:hypothetical protein
MEDEDDNNLGRGKKFKVFVGEIISPSKISLFPNSLQQPSNQDLT